MKRLLSAKEAVETKETKERRCRHSCFPNRRDNGVKALGYAQNAQFRQNQML